MPAYTQGMMDLGALLCLPRKPDCARGPVAGLCQAHAAGNAESFPVRTRTLKRSSQSLWLLHARNPQGDVFLTKRADTGIWAGLHCGPVFDSEQSVCAVLAGSALSSSACQRLQVQPAFLHVLTHRDLLVHTCELTLVDDELLALEAALPGGRWVSAQHWPALGLPAPVRRMLECRSI